MLQKSRIAVLALIALVVPLCAGAQPAPQTARQALIEMFFGKAPGSLDKHLPDAFREAIAKATAGQSNSTLATFALLGPVAGKRPGTSNLRSWPGLVIY